MVQAKQVAKHGMKSPGSGAYFSELLSTSRQQSGWSQAEVARAIGISEATIASWEIGRRRPGHRSRQRVIEVADLVGIDVTDLNHALSELGLAPVPAGRFIPLLERRKSIDVLRDECAAYTWPTLAMNEDFEVIAWNDAANDLSELDFGVDLAEPAARHLLRMALSEHYRDKLLNWDEVIGIMASMWKTTGFDPLAPEGSTPYFDNLMAYVVAHHPDQLGRLLGLWQNATPFTEGQRVVFDASWRTSAGSSLKFNCQLTSWSDFDAVAAFDWHPADAATWNWLDARRDERLSRRPGEPRSNDPRGPSSARAMLRFARERNGLTQRELAARAGVSDDLVHSIEAGRKALSEPTLRKLAHAMTLNAADRNALFEAAGYEPEPSDQHAYILGFDVSSSARYGHSLNRRMSWTPAAVGRELTKYPWPVVVVDEHCEVISSNRPADDLFEVAFSRLPPGPGRNLFALVTDSRFRQRTLNWETVVARVLPGNLEAYLAPPGERRAKQPGYFDEVVDFVRRRAAAEGQGDEVIRETFDAWRAGRSQRRAARVTFAMQALQGAGPVLFNVVISPWDAMIDPYWAIELHPGNASTWARISA